MLTDKAVKNLQPKGEVAYDIPDDTNTYPGLRLRVSPKGKKTWFYRYKNPVNNKQTVKLTIGEYGQSKMGYVSLADARSEWTRLNQIRRGGSNPKEYKQEHARSEEQPAEDDETATDGSGTVRELVKDYVDAISIKRKSWKVTKRILERELDQYMDTPARDVTKANIRAILDRLNDRPVLSNRTLAAIRAMYNWGIKKDWSDEDYLVANPCRSFEANKEISRDHTLSEPELKKLFKGLPKSLMTDDQQDVLLFVLLTGCRIGEACAMERKEIHDAAWRQPGSKTKNGRSHIVYLSPPARAILKRHQGETYVFHSETTACKHLRVDGVEKALRLSLEGMKLDRFTPHDLRRTFATWCGDKEIPERVHDRLLNHYQKSLRKTYDTSKYNKPAKAAWLMWGRYIAKLQGAARGK